MLDFIQHTPETAPENSKDILRAVEKDAGFIPHFLATIAEAPSVLEVYITMAGINEKSSLSETENQVVLITASRFHECHYCMPAHSTVAAMSEVPDEVITALRKNVPISDEKLEILHQTTLNIMENRGWLDDKHLDKFLSVGYGKAQLLEILPLIALKTLSNYANHLMQTPVDDAFIAQSWKAQA